MSTTSRIYTCALAAFFVMHFSLVLISALPVNQIAISLRAPINAYVGPLFAQNWALFGPNPPDYDVAIIAQYRIDRGSRSVDSQWYDVSEALHDRVRHNPATPLAIVSQLLNRTAESMNNDKAKTLPGENYAVDVPGAMAVAARTAAAYERTLSLPGRLRAVRVSLLIHSYPRFSERGKRDQRSVIDSRFDYPWYTSVDSANLVSLKG